MSWRKQEKDKYDYLEENLRLKDLLGRNNIGFNDCGVNNKNTYCYISN